MDNERERSLEVCGYGGRACVEVLQVARAWKEHASTEQFCHATATILLGQRRWLAYRDSCDLPPHARFLNSDDGHATGRLPPSQPEQNAGVTLNAKVASLPV